MYSLLTSQPLLDYYLLVFLFGLMHFGSRSLAGTNVSLYKLLLDFYGLVLGNIIFIIPFFLWYKLNFWAGFLSFPIGIIFFLFASIFFHSTKFLVLKTRFLHLLNWVSFVYVLFKIYQIYIFDYYSLTNI